MRSFVISILICLLPLTLKAQDMEGTPGATYTPVDITLQTEEILTQHWEMPTLYNPAATGLTDFIRIRGAARIPLLGSHQSPKNFVGTADAPFKLLGKRIGAGVVAQSQSYDLFRDFLVGAQGSFKFRFKQSTISIGLQIGYFHSTFKGSELKLSNNTNNPDEEEGEEPEPDDTQNYLPTFDVKGGAFDLGLGLRWDHPKFYAEISAMHLTGSEMKLTQDGSGSSASQYIKAKLPMTLYFGAGGNIGLNNTLFTLQPSLLGATDFDGFHGVVEMRATYNRKLTFGADYRYNRAFGILAGVYLKDFYVGYSWEYDYKFHPKGSTGNHEIVLGYRLKMDLGDRHKYSQRSIRLM